MTDSPSTDVARRDDTKSLEPFGPDTSGAEIEAAGTVQERSKLPAPRELNALWKMAGAYAQMPGMSKTYAGNQPAVMAALLTAWQLDLPTSPIIVNEFYGWEQDGRATLYPSTQVLVGLAAKHGVEIWFSDDSSAASATAFARRQGDERVHTYTYTYEMAKAANLANKSNWKAAPDVMCRYRAARRLLKTAMPDVALGIPRNILDSEPIPAASRAELEARAVPIEDTDSAAEEPEDTFDPPAPRVLLASETWARDVLAHCAEAVPEGVRPGALAGALVRHVTKGERSELSTVRRGSEQLALKDRFVEYRNGRWTLDVDDQGVATLVEATPDAPFTVSQDGGDGGSRSVLEGDE